jgi:hypothetical protein
MGDNDRMSVAPTPHLLRPGIALVTLVAAWLLPCGHMAQAQDGSKPVYRCPGPPVLYTDALTPAEARDRNCRTIEGAPVTVVQGRGSARSAASAGAAASGTGSAASGGAAPPAPGAAPRAPVDRIDPAAQRARDSDARRILADELRREEERLAVLQKEFNQGEPERRGDERNYQKYLDRMAEMRAQIQRKEADIAALRRELAKLPP